MTMLGEFTSSSMACFLCFLMDDLFPLYFASKKVIHHCIYEEKQILQDIKWLISVYHKPTNQKH